MKKQLAVAAGAAIALGLTAGVASAQCTYAHPAKAKAFKSSLVQAQVSCGNPGGNSPNSQTPGGVPACAPPTTIAVNDGDAANQWKFGVKGEGTLGFAAAKNKVCSTPAAKPPCPMGDKAEGSRGDLTVTVKMKDIVDKAGDPVSEVAGLLKTVTRATLNDPDNGAITVVDFPAQFPVPVLDGKVNLKTSANNLLFGLNQDALPTCSELEIVSLIITDENGTNFALPGIFLPE